jgi:hypothetical protein
VCPERNVNHVTGLRLEEIDAPDRISGRYAARLSSRFALLGANAALRAARFEPVTPAFGVRHFVCK